MKKFILFAAAAVAFVFAACSNNSEKTEEAAEVQEVAVVEEAVVDSVAADSVVADTTVVVEEAVAE